MRGTHPQRVLRCFVGLCLSLCFFSNSLASVEVCQQPAAFSHISVAYYDYDKSFFERALGAIKQKNYNFDLLFRLSDNWRIGAGHRYTILEIEPIEPQANGHLHTFFLPLHREIQSDHRGFRLSVAPALSASSNVMKDPGEYNADSFQLIAALVWSRRLSDRAIIRYGVCGDHRFGKFGIYPSVSVDLQLHSDWTIRLGFPTSQLNYQIASRLVFSLQIAPDGNEWSVKDRSLESRSTLVHEAWLLEWTASWLVHEHFIIKFGLGRQFENRYEMTLLNEDRASLHTGSVNRLGVVLTWRF